MCKVLTEVDQYEVDPKDMNQYLLKIRIRSYDLKKAKQNKLKKKPKKQKNPTKSFWIRLLLYLECVESRQ